MTLLRQGSVGADVRRLQLSLKAAGYDPGDLDGRFGPATRAAVIDLQTDYEELAIDGLVGPRTLAWLEQAHAVRATREPPTLTPAAGDVSLWDRWIDVVDLLTDPRKPVRYGPGRGLFVDGRWVVTHGPGRQGHTRWGSMLGRTYPSFHCSSFTNFFLGWVTGRDEKYTHSGNIPSLFRVCEGSDALHHDGGYAPWRGYGAYCSPVLGDGSVRKRTHFTQRHLLTLSEVYERRAEWPTFMVWAQSTPKGGGRYKWWHHTGLWCKSPDGRLYRIAADGWRGSAGYSGTPMRWTEITPELAAKDRKIYRAYTVHPPAGVTPSSVTLEVA